MTNSSQQPTNHQWMLEGQPKQVLLKMSGPMLLAIFLLFAYDVLETQLLSNISLEALTALGFTVPVTTGMAAFAIAVTIATNTAVTKAMSKSQQQTNEVSINALILAVLLSLLFSLLAYLFNEPIFKFLGIDYAMLPESYHLGPRPKLLPLVEAYMTWRYLGWVFLVLIWQVNSLLRAAGLIKHASTIFCCWMASKIIIALGCFNGLIPSPDSALETAALIHFVTDFAFAAIALLVLFKQFPLRINQQTPIRPLQTLIKLSVVGIPATLQQLLTPLSITLLTVLVVVYGQIYVAVLGIIFRLEVLLLLIPMALTTTLPSIIGVNWWSGRFQRVSDFLIQSKILVIVSQLIVAMLLFIYATEIAAWFSDQTPIQYNVESYLKIVPIGYIGAGITIICQSSFNATGHYLQASILSISHRLILKLGCCYVGLTLKGIEGLFIGILIAYILSAVLTAIMAHYTIHRKQTQQPQTK